MELTTIFLNKWGRTRSGWRLLIFVVINFLLTTILFVAVVGGLYLVPAFGARDSVQRFLEGYWGWIIQALVLLSAGTLAGWSCGRLLEGLPARALGWTLDRSWIIDLLKGSLVGALSLVLAVLIALAAGGYRFTFAAAGGMLPAVLKTLVTSAVVFVIAAAAEEVLFRGYALQTMTRARLALVGVVLTSIVFAYIHRDNPNNPPGFLPFSYIGLDFVNLPFINTALAGLWLAVAYLRTRNLWFPLGVHWSWNWTMGSLMGLPVSGIERLAPAPLLRAADTGPSWLTGGAYGIEGGTACTLALLLSTIFLWRTRLVSPAPEMLKLTNEENPRPGVPANDTFEKKHDEPPFQTPETFEHER